MERELKKRLQHATVDLVEGSKGIFDIKKDGQLIYSKYQTGRFPQIQEILDKLN